MIVIARKGVCKANAVVGGETTWMQRLFQVAYFINVED